MHSILKRIRSHRKVLKQAFLVIALLIVICLIFSIWYFYFYFPEPPEDQLVVAISPFYYIDNFGNTDFNISIADDFKEKIENNKDLGIKVKRLDPPPIRNIKDAEFQGKKEGAHLVIYGEKKSKIGNIEEIKCYIIPLSSLKATSTELKNFIIENVEYSTVIDEQIIIIESLKENVSSIVYTIGALKWYNKGNDLVKLGRYEEARKAFKVARQFDPTFEISSNITVSIEDLIGNINYIDFDIYTHLLDASIIDFNKGDFSSIKIEILINESAVIASQGNIPNLSINLGGRNKTIEYDFNQHRYLIEENILLKGNYWLYPFDRYLSEIRVIGWVFNKKHKTQLLKKSGFKLKTDYHKDTISIELSRNIFLRYIFSVLFLIVFGLSLNTHIKNLNISHFTDKKIFELNAIIIPFFISDLFFGFNNLNLMMSIGIFPFIIFILFFGYKIYKIRKNR